MTFDDAALIAGARQGSAEAVDALYRRYWPIAWQWAYALTGHRQRADDLAQDAVLSAFASLGRFDVERPFRPANQDLRLKANLAQLGDALLGRLGFEFAGRPDVGHEGDMHVDHIVRTDLKNELPNRFEEGQPFDIAHGAANFRNHDIDFFGIGDLANAGLDFISHVRNHLNGFPQIIAASFLQDHALVNLPTR